MNEYNKYKTFYMKYHFSFSKATTIILGMVLLSLAGCGIYTLNDVSIDYTKVKTIKVFFIENKASYVNPQLSPKLYDKLLQKITNSTKLTRTNNDDAHYQVTATITGYNPSQTVGISAQQATTNRLTVTVHVSLKKTLENKTDEFDVSRSADFSANLSLQQAEGQLLDEMVRNLTDEIFNHIFSNW
jgi:Lipopolysaccharide-assembly